MDGCQKDDHFEAQTQGRHEPLEWLVGTGECLDGQYRTNMICGSRLS